MSTQTYKVNEQVRILAAEFAEEAIGKTGTLTDVMSAGAPFRDYNGIDHRFEIRMGDDYDFPGAHVFASSIEKVEPEDTDDVEPEPLKEGDWVQVWAQVDRLRSDGDTVIRFFYGVKHADGTPKDFYEERVRNDAIVRPDAGQVPPWVKPARCTSLFMMDKTTNLRRCEQEAGHQAKHVVGWVAWTDTEAYGRVEVSS